MHLKKFSCGAIFVTQLQMQFSQFSDYVCMSDNAASYLTILPPVWISGSKKLPNLAKTWLVEWWICLEPPQVQQKCF